MKYLVRALKYFVYLFIILALLIAVLVLTKVVDGNLSTMFVNGTDSLWQIALVMAVFALIYPRFGYSTLPLHMGGFTEEIAPVVKKAMDARGYRLSAEDADGGMVFLKASPLDRAVKMWEDAITFTRTATGYDMEGHNRELLRCRNAIMDLNQQTPGR